MGNGRLCSILGSYLVPKTVPTQFLAPMAASKTGPQSPDYVEEKKKKRNYCNRTAQIYGMAYLHSIFSIT
jgi:hypothetical protein